MLPMPDRDLPRRISGCPLDMRNTGSKIGTHSHATETALEIGVQP